jgi:hypothetical protein
VHDALSFDSSERPGEEREVEPSPPRLRVRRACHGEGDAALELGRQRATRLGDPIRVGIDRKDGRCRACVLTGHPAVAAAELQDVQAVDGRERAERPKLDSFWIDPPDHDDWILRPAARVATVQECVMPASLDVSAWRTIVVTLVAREGHGSLLGVL